MSSPDSRLQHVLAAGAAERRRHVPIGAGAGAGPPRQRRRVGEFVSTQLCWVLRLDRGAQRTRAMDALEVVVGLTDELTDDAMEAVFVALSEGECRSIGRLCSTTKALGQLCRDDNFWKRLCFWRAWDLQALGPQETWKNRFVTRCLQVHGGGFPRPPTRLERARRAAEAAVPVVGGRLGDVACFSNVLLWLYLEYNQLGRMTPVQLLAFAGVPVAVIEVFLAFMRSLPA